MIRKKIPGLLCAAALMIIFGGCAGQMSKKYNRINSLLDKTRENNLTACTEGCMLFEGDSNIELIYVQNYFSGPVCNYSRRGSTTNDLLERKEHVSKLRPSVIIMLAGGNDLLRLTPQTKIAENYGRLISYYRSISDRLFCISNLPLSVHPKLYLKNSDIIRINQELEKECRKQGATYVNAYPELLKDGLLNPDYAMDPVHLNQAGQEVLINTLKKHLKK